MKRFLKPAFIIGLAAAGLYGSVLGARALKQAITRSQDLYRIDTVGSQIESELEYEIQESRRAFLYALAVSDPNEQLPYIDQSRAASRSSRPSSIRRCCITTPWKRAWCIASPNGSTMPRCRAA